MKFLSLKGKVYNVNITDYLIRWDRVVSKPQKAVKDFLYKYWKNDVVLEEFRCPGSLLRIDIFNASKRIAVEVSPAQHTSYNEFFHKGNRANYLASLKRDMQKAEFCKVNNIILVEIFDEDGPINKKFFKDKYDIDL